MRRSRSVSEALRDLRPGLRRFPAEEASALIAGLPSEFFSRGGQPRRRTGRARRRSVVEPTRRR
jgi:hypothetical protein